jgi:outer membrane cobalamin receptor
MKYIKLLIISAVLSGQITASADNAVAQQGDISAEKKPSSSDGIIIHGRPVSTIEDASTKTSISSADVKEHSDKTLDDSLKNVPGLQIITHKKGNVRASFRGFDQKMIAILIDGVPINDIYSSDIDISNIPVSDISEIIVSRGATSALYGTMGGVGIIDIITRKPDYPYCEAKTEFGEYNNLFLTASAGAPMGNFFFKISGEYDHNEGYEVSAKLDKKTKREWFDKLVRYDLYGLDYDDVILPGKDDYINDTGIWDHTEHDRYALSGKAGYKFNGKSETGISADYSYKTGKTNSYQTNAYSNYKESSGTWDDPVFDVTSDPMDIKNAAFRNRSFVYPSIHSFNISPYLNLSLNDIKIKNNAFFSYRKAVQEKYASTDHSWPSDTVLADTALEPFSTIKEYLSYGGRINPSFELAWWNRLSFAFFYKYDIYNESEQAISAEESPAIAATIFGLDPYPVKRLEASYLTAAVEDEVKFGRLSFSAGVSYDAQFFHTFKNREALYQFDDAYVVEENSDLLGTKDAFNPVAGATVTPVEDFLILRAAASKKTRFPDLSEYSMIVDDKRDNGLEPETAYNLNTGFELLFFDRIFSFRTDYFMSRIENKIEKISGGIDPPVNIGEVRSQGIETIISLEGADLTNLIRIFLDLSYTYLHSRNLDDTPEEKVNKGVYLEYTPEHQICADIKIKYKHDTTFSVWGYSTINQIVYAMKSRPASSASYSTEYFEAVRLHDPVMVNVKLSEKFFSNYEIYIMCKNIFDDYNADPFIPGPGRIFYIGLSAEL